MLDVWYVLEDGGVVDPAEVMTLDNGRLRAKSGALVAERAPGVPRTRGVIAADMRAEAPARGYKTRDSKAR